jgi:ribose 5-phosphate isomerase B
MNVICMGGRAIGPYAGWDILEAFMGAKFSQAPRHLRRLAKVSALEPETSSYRSKA